tara:strand:- start:75 stop:332 length:258 start_codon:yes stop_codon:yes gene_type:complete
MAEESYKYSLEYRERFGFNGGEIYWMEQAFELFCEKAAEQVKQSEKDGKPLIFTESYFPMVFKDIVEKAKQWSNQPKTYPDHEYE